MTLMQITSTPTEELITESNIIPKTDVDSFSSNPTKPVVSDHDDNVILTSYETRKPIVIPRIVTSDNNAKFSIGSKKTTVNGFMLILVNFLFLLTKIYF